MARVDVDWSTVELAPAMSVAVTVSRFKTSPDSRLSNVEKLRSAMEAAALVFIPETGGGVGVRLHEPGLRRKTKSLKSQQSAELTGWRLGTWAVPCRLAPESRSRELARWPFESASSRSFFQSGISAAFSALTMTRPSEPPMKPRRPGRCLDVISKFISSSKRKSMISSFGAPLTRFVMRTCTHIG